MVRATALLTRCLQQSAIPVTSVGCPIGLELEQRETARHLTLVA